MTASIASLYYLHPTMYLLIRHIGDYVIIINLYLHPTMYLLIRLSSNQYLEQNENLHPTMYLLIPIRQSMHRTKDKIIYIPLCIY